MQCAPDVIVVLGLVAETTTVSVDHQSPGTTTLREQKEIERCAIDGSVRKTDRRCPPGFVHVAELRAD